MGLLTRLRSWLFGTSEDEEESDTEADPAEPRLDPDNVTEARGDSADDAVDRLQSVTARQERNEEESE